MTPAFLFPAVVAGAALLLASLVHRALPPRAAAFTLTGTLVVTAGATVWSLAMLALDFLVDLTGWCRDALGGHVHVPPTIGAAALGITLWGSVAAVGTARRRRRATRASMADGDLLVLETSAPLAYAVPGRHPHVVVSEGMLALLEPNEQRAMLAHEFAHLRHHHHRFLALSELAGSFVPPLRLVANRVRFATERWADQDAVRQVGDPTVLARAIARAALASSNHDHDALALGVSDVPARIEELTSPRSSTRFPAPAPIAILMLGAVAVVAAAVQLHHVIDYIGTFC
jgi:hypothetical protein